MYNYYKMLTDSTAKYIDSFIVSGTSDIIARRKFSTCWKDVNYILNSMAYSFDKQGLKLDKEKVFDILYHNYTEKRPEYWCFDFKPDEYRVMNFYRKSEDAYTLIRSKNITFSELPNIYEFGNCIILTDSAGLKAEYLPAERRLFYVCRHENDYKGFCLSDNKKSESVFKKTA